MSFDLPALIKLKRRVSKNLSEKPVVSKVIERRRDSSEDGRNKEIMIANENLRFLFFPEFHSKRSHCFFTVNPTVVYVRPWFDVGR
jgi:hypothetical protein